jgi:hypothetical protein
MTISPVPLAMVSLNVAARLLEHLIIIDTTATAKPNIGFATGEDMYVNATETGVNLEISATSTVVVFSVPLSQETVTVCPMASEVPEMTTFAFLSLRLILQ